MTKLVPPGTHLSPTMPLVGAYKALAIVLAATWLLAGCADADSVQPTLGDDAAATSSGEDPAGLGQANGGSADSIEEIAKSGGASDAQLEAFADGDVSFDEYRDAVGEAVACMRDAGIDVINDHVDESGPFPIISYSHAADAPGLTSSEVQQLSTSCLETHSMFVEMAYQTGPAAVEAEDEHFEQYREAFVECLEDAGSRVDESASRDELEQEAIQVSIDGGADCFRESGLDG